MLGPTHSALSSTAERGPAYATINAMPEIVHNRYKLLKKCGSGGTGEVYKALDIRLGRVVAIKRVRDGTGGDHSQKASRLLKEAQHLAQVDHPNVVAIHDVLEDEHSVAIVMELVEGIPFRDLFEKRAIPEEEFLPYFRQLLAALKAVHEAGLIHRDVNPKNIVVGPGGELKLTDFGLSGSVKDPNLRLGGTVGYMAPEALRKSSRISFGVDIYAAGFLLYQALLGLPRFRRFYGTTTPREWVRWLLSRERFRTLVELEAPVSPGLSSILEKMLEKDPKARYAKVAAVESDLEELEKQAAAAREAAARTAAGGPSAVAGVRRLFPSLLAGSREETEEDVQEN